MAGSCLLYTSDAADERSSVDLGGRRIINKKKQEEEKNNTIITRHNQATIADHTEKRYDDVTNL